MQSPDPVYIWQVFEDGEWGTISMMLTHPASMITGTSDGHNLVLQTRRRELAYGDMQKYAEMHRAACGLPVRLHRFTPDPGFEMELP